MISLSALSTPQMNFLLGKLDGKNVKSTHRGDHKNSSVRNDETRWLEDENGKFKTLPQYQNYEHLFPLIIKYNVCTVRNVDARRWESSLLVKDEEASKAAGTPVSKWVSYMDADQKNSVKMALIRAFYGDEIQAC